jgi:adenine-specific DNA-methyltransferase
MEKILINGVGAGCRLEWTGKSEAIREAGTPPLMAMRAEVDKSKDWDKTGNLFIGGDSLEALKLLQDEYAGRVKMIYIDPPYNTGKDFEYRDKYTHSDWLNLMYPRLALARNLLQEEGVIFISIDDHEVHHLRMVCDELFGEENFLGIFITCSTPNARDYGHIGKMHEFCLYYAKNSLYTKTNLLEDKDKTFKYSDQKGGYNIHPLYNSNVAFSNKNRPNLYYPFYLYPGKKMGECGEKLGEAGGKLVGAGAVFFEIGLTPAEGAIEIFPPRSLKDNVQFVWRWGKNKAAEQLNREIVGYRTQDGEYRIVQKMRTFEKVIRSMLTGAAFSSRRGTAELEELFGKKIFSFPKPLSLITHFARTATDKDSIVLDFFAGSGTTAHAVLQLNAEDGGNRRFLCVQLSENTVPDSEAALAGYGTIADIARERIRRCGEKLKDRAMDTGFRAFRLDKQDSAAGGSNGETNGPIAEAVLLEE